MIADNRLTENSVWDDRLLAEQLKELSVLDLDFSLEATGFEMGEIDLRIESLTPEAEASDDPADAIPPPTNAPAVSRAGRSLAARTASGLLRQRARRGCLREL